MQKRTRIRDCVKQCDTHVQHLTCSPSLVGFHVCIRLISNGDSKIFQAISSTITCNPRRTGVCNLFPENDSSLSAEWPHCLDTAKFCTVLSQSLNFKEQTERSWAVWVKCQSELSAGFQTLDFQRLSPHRETRKEEWWTTTWCWCMNDSKSLKDIKTYQNIAICCMPTLHLRPPKANCRTVMTQILGVKLCFRTSIQTISYIWRKVPLHSDTLDGFGCWRPALWRGTQRWQRHHGPCEMEAAMLFQCKNRLRYDMAICFCYVDTSRKERKLFEMGWVVQFEEICQITYSRSNHHQNILVSKHRSIKKNHPKIVP